MYVWISHRFGAEVLSLAHRASVSIHTDTADPSPSTNTHMESTLKESIFLSYQWHRMVFLQSAVVLAIPCSDSSIQPPRCEWCTPDQTQQSSQTPAKQKYTQTPFMTSGAPLNIWKLIKAISPKKMLIVIFCKVRHECITYVYTLKTLHTHPDTPQEA